MPDLSPQHDTSALAPKFWGVLRPLLADLNAQGIDAYVYEALRSEELQQYYFSTGASHAAHAYYSWHYYGLAVDILSESRLWKVWPERNKSGLLIGGDPAWYNPVVQNLRTAGLTWGGNWLTIFDAPHFQWGNMPNSPHDAPRIYTDAGGGLAGRQAVWRAVGAD